MKTVILTGPKHSGKTSAGRALASLCSCEFIDIDDLIRQRTGKSPRQLYSEGQAVFQKAEVEAAAALFNEVGGEGQRVIAAGGGIIDNEEAAVVLKKVREEPSPDHSEMVSLGRGSGATVVYLNISAESAWDRIAKSGELPPFLRTENPRETHRVLHERRAAAYSLIADIVIEAGLKTPREIAEEILSHLS
jgi:shikimate kinase